MSGFNWASYIAIFCAFIFFCSTFVGYVWCHFIKGPKILNKYKIRTIKESYIWLGNVFNIETELKELGQARDDKEISNTLETIKICKYLLFSSLLGFIIFHGISGL